MTNVRDRLPSSPHHAGATIPKSENYNDREI